MEYNDREFLQNNQVSYLGRPLLFVRLNLILKDEMFT